MGFFRYILAKSCVKRVWEYKIINIKHNILLENVMFLFGCWLCSSRKFVKMCTLGTVMYDGRSDAGIRLWKNGK